jgi:hypothetical protein
MIISPIITGLSCAAFFLFYQVWKYLFLWQMGQPASGDTGGLFFPKALTHVFVGLYIQHICLAALFFLAKAFPEGGLTVVLIAFTAGYHYILRDSYGPLLHSLPLNLADQTYGIANIAHEDEDEDAGFERDFGEKKAVVPGDKLKSKDVADTDGAQQDIEASRIRKAEEEEAEFEARVDAGDPIAVATARQRANAAGASTSKDVTANAARRRQGGGMTRFEDVLPSTESIHSEFMHPALEPQRIVWIPRDELGLGDSEVKENEKMGIASSDAGAALDVKGNVDVSSVPPGEENKY